MASGSMDPQNKNTLEAVALATNQFEDIVESLLGHAKDVSGVLKNRKITVQKNDKTGGKFVDREKEVTESSQLEHQQHRMRRESAGTDDVLQ
ncbi:hypothetical protein PRIPAC_72993 [Pristionchus pacificus]|uniref:Uncharacterized protein n=1 Tax=Pristionchus pacificus TaxID=54126 RepID=A0A2A6BEY5_PRIPA|nr:hypothetical protein PRIPAC_72993 [Pristionchus pacificus]|eukprot:PDM64444.1 hypothetical protein PRIPAC_52700 [Pristionchus pacificus]